MSDPFKLNFRGPLEPDALERMTISKVLRPTFAGIEIIESDLLMITVEDWSRVRSPGRARRRMKRGFKQNIQSKKVPDPKVYMVGNTATMHPDVARKLEDTIAQQVQKGIDDQWNQALYGELDNPFKMFR